MNLKIKNKVKPTKTFNVGGFYRLSGAPPVAMGVLPAAGSPGLHLQRSLGGVAGNGTGYIPSSLFFVDNIAFAIPLGVALSTLSLLTFLGNAMVVHAIRTERKLHTVSFSIVYLCVV